MENCANQLSSELMEPRADETPSFHITNEAPPPPSFNGVDVGVTLRQMISMGEEVSRSIIGNLLESLPDRVSRIDNGANLQEMSAKMNLVVDKDIDHFHYLNKDEHMFSDIEMELLNPTAMYLSSAEAIYERSTSNQETPLRLSVLDQKYLTESSMQTAENDRSHDVRLLSNASSLVKIFDSDYPLADSVDSSRSDADFNPADNDKTFVTESGKTQEMSAAIDLVVLRSPESDLSTMDRHASILDPSVSGNELMEVMRQNHTRCQMILREIIETEVSYVNDLTNLVHNFFDLVSHAYLDTMAATISDVHFSDSSDIIATGNSVAGGGHAWITFDQKQSICRNATVLLRTQKLFLKTMERCLVDENPSAKNQPTAAAGHNGGHLFGAVKAPHGNPRATSIGLSKSSPTISVVNEKIDIDSMNSYTKVVERIAGCFLTFFPKFEATYVLFCSKHDTALGVIAHLKNNQNTQWTQLMEVSNSRMASRLELQDFLMKPVQRICKYPLLLKELFKSAKVHADAADRYRILTGNGTNYSPTITSPLHPQPSPDYKAEEKNSIETNSFTSTNVQPLHALSTALDKFKILLFTVNTGKRLEEHEVKKQLILSRLVSFDKIFQELTINASFDIDASLMVSKETSIQRASNLMGKFLRGSVLRVVYGSGRNNADALNPLGIVDLDLKPMDLEPNGMDEIGASEQEKSFDAVFLFEQCIVTLRAKKSNLYTLHSVIPMNQIFCTVDFITDSPTDSHPLSLESKSNESSPPSPPLKSVDGLFFSWRCAWTPKAPTASFHQTMSRVSSTLHNTLDFGARSLRDKVGWLEELKRQLPKQSQKIQKIESQPNASEHPAANFSRQTSLIEAASKSASLDEINRSQSLKLRPTPASAALSDPPLIFPSSLGTCPAASKSAQKINASYNVSSNIIKSTRRRIVDLSIELMAAVKQMKNQIDFMETRFMDVLTLDNFVPSMPTGLSPSSTVSNSNYLLNKKPSAKSKLNGFGYSLPRSIGSSNNVVLPKNSTNSEQHASISSLSSRAPVHSSEDFSPSTPDSTPAPLPAVAALKKKSKNRIGRLFGRGESFGNASNVGSSDDSVCSRSENELSLTQPSSSRSQFQNATAGVDHSRITPKLAQNHDAVLIKPPGNIFKKGKVSWSGLLSNVMLVASTSSLKDASDSAVPAPAFDSFKSVETSSRIKYDVTSNNELVGERGSGPSLDSLNTTTFPPPQTISTIIESKQNALRSSLDREKAISTSFKSANPLLKSLSIEHLQESIGIAGSKNVHSSQNTSPTSIQHRGSGKPSKSRIKSLISKILHKPRQHSQESISVPVKLSVDSLSCDVDASA